MSTLFTPLAKNSTLKTWKIGIPAHKTCPTAGECADYCYTDKGPISWPLSRQAQENRFQITLTDSFTSIASYEIARKKMQVIRIHDSGDFYNAEYLSKWCTIAHENPNVQFYAYTKRVSLFKSYAAWIPSNLHYVFSFGGKEDHLIDLDNDPHCIIPHDSRDHQKYVNLGYVDASKDDSKMIGAAKVVLNYH